MPPTHAPLTRTPQCRFFSYRGLRDPASSVHLETLRSVPVSVPVKRKKKKSSKKKKKKSSKKKKAKTEAEKVCLLS